MVWQSAWLYLWLAVVVFSLGLLGYLTDDGGIMNNIHSTKNKDACSVWTCPATDKLLTQITQLQNTVDELKESLIEPSLIRDCSDIREGQSKDGVYEVRPEKASSSFKVSCVFDDQGSWTVLQRRVNAATDFNRASAEYEQGFGTLDQSSNHWLGLRKMRLITRQRQYTLRIDVTDVDNKTYFAEYDSFSVWAPTTCAQPQYSGNFGRPTGTLGDLFDKDRYHYSSNRPFETFDRHFDCDPGSNGGWWYHGSKCVDAQVNGGYVEQALNNGASATLAYAERQTYKGIRIMTKNPTTILLARETMMRIRPTFPE